jgi:hypothetical protein
MICLPLPTVCPLHNLRSKFNLDPDYSWRSTLTRISDFIIAVVDLLEAEGRSLRHWVTRLTWGIVFIGGAAVLGITAFSFFLWGLYQYLAWATDPAAAALLVGVIALGLAGILALGTRWLTR